MAKYKNIIIGILVIAALVGLFLFIKKSSSENGQANIGGNRQISFKDAVGKQAPDFILKDINGNDVRLSSLRGKNVILFFNEGLMCYPACLNQVAELSKDNRFNNEKTNAFSIVVDDSGSWEKAQRELPYLSGAKVLFDNNEDVSRAYDVLYLPSVMHYGRYPGHTYFVIDKNGVIRYALDDPQMGIRNGQLFAELQKLQ